MIERNTLARAGVNALPLIRVAASPKIAEYFNETPPEERTWLAAGAIALAIAGSPLSQDPDRIRHGASIGTALSLTSAFDYLVSYTGIGQKTPEEDVTTRNSAARRAASSPIDKLVTVIDEKMPFITPDHLTEAGKALVLGAAVLAVKRPDKPALPTAMYTIGSLLDTLDGALARKKGANEDGSTTVDGMLKDVRSDKIQEIITFGALSMIARRRGNNVAADNYAAAAMSAVLPALSRAHAESNGFIVAEGGIGTRVGRGILGGVGMGFNKHRDTSDILSAVVATNNIITTDGRRQVAKRGEAASNYKGVNTSGKFMHEARIKRKALMPLAAAGLVVGVALLKRRNK